MTKRIELSWKLDGFVDGQRYYCSETPIDLLNLPAAKVVLTGDVRTYIDTAVEAGKTYYVAVGSVKNGVEKLSAVVSISTAGLSQALKDLFATSEKGFTYNFQDLSTLWQDVAGTIPVTAVDDYVARADDLSGNGNHLIQPNSLRRPQLKQDSEGYYLWFDGSKTMNTSGVVDLLDLQNFTFFSRLTKEVTATSCIVEASTNYNQGISAFSVFQDSNRLAFSKIGAGYTTAQVDLDNDSFFVGVMELLKTPKISAMRINGTERTRYAQQGVAAWGLINNQIFVGARAGTSLFLTSKVRAFGFVGRALTSGEIESIEGLLMP